MPYIAVPSGTAERIDRMVQVMGVRQTAQFLGITAEQAENLAKGTGRVFRADRGEPGRVEGAVQVIEKHLMRIQKVEPKGIAKADVPFYIQRIAERMNDKGPQRTFYRRKQYMSYLRQLGMDPKNLPMELRT